MIKRIDELDLKMLNELAINFDLSVSVDDLKKENNHYIGYTNNQMLVAFLNYSVYYERAEINYIYVLNSFRNQKIATKLLCYMFKELKKLENITLEVRKSNLNAIKLYEKNGFKTCATRKNYYGKEDALLMIKKLGDNNE